MNKSNKFARVKVWARRMARWLVMAVLLYGLIILVGLIPVNNDFDSAEDGIELFLVSNAVHADIIVPVSSEIVDWANEFKNVSFPDDVSGETHVAIGWGDKGFFLETETWDDFKFSTAANALLIPSGSCVHVSFISPWAIGNASSVSVTKDQYRELVSFIKKTMVVNANGEYVQIEGRSYHTTDAFIEANGNYHLMNTCNSWIGRALKSAGVRVPWLSPLPKTPMLYLPQLEYGLPECD